jgi:hypothetical protein
MLKELNQKRRSRITRNAGSLLPTHGRLHPYLVFLDPRLLTVGGAELLLVPPLILEPLPLEVDPGWAGPTSHCRHYCLPI